MKNILIALTLVLSFHALSVSIKSYPINVSKSFTGLSLLGTNENFVYLLTHTKEQTHLVSLNKNDFTEHASIEIDYSKRAPTKIVFKADKLVFFQCTSENRTSKVSATVLNSQNLEIITQRTEIASYSSPRGDTDWGDLYPLGPVNDNIVIFNSESGTISASSKFNYQWLDENLKETNSGKLDIEEEERNKIVDNAQITESGNIVVCSAEKDISKKKTKHTYIIDRNNEVKDFSFDSEEIYTHQEGIVTYGNLVVRFGLCSPKSNNGYGMNQYFIQVVDAEKKEQLLLEQKPMPIEFVIASYKQKQQPSAIEKFKKKGKLPLVSTGKLVDMIFTSEKDVIVMLERNSIFDPGQGNGATKYDSDGMRLMKFNLTEGLEWTKYIPKKQQSLNDKGFYNSAKLVDISGELYLIYNDHKANFKKHSKYYEAYQRAKIELSDENIVNLVKINKDDGTFSKQNVFEGNTGSFLASPRSSIYNQSLNEVVMISISDQGPVLTHFK